MKESGPYLPGSVWTYLDAFGLFVAGLFGSLVAIALGVAVNGGEELADVPLLITSSLGQAVVLAAILMYMSRSRGTDSWELDFGWRFESSDWLGLVFGMALQLGVTIFVLLPLAWLLQIDDPPQQDVADIAAGVSSIGGRIAILLILVVVAPVSEELLYRGVLLGRLRRSYSAHTSVVVSAAIFSAIHLIDPNAAFVVPGLFVIGLVLGYQALKTGRIGLSIMTHAGVNLLAAIALLLGLDV
ncbi:MAG: type II CAAX endopeptidase family protein [Acidimicrobiia bacterium]|nr:type II CAAX endopeptidase family protein [Acidimicrobiia bacterium]MDX2467488.1 type II CAAX endopeptidase family protein [Acidimicrobiia bacterium]